MLRQPDERRDESTAARSAQSTRDAVAHARSAGPHELDVLLHDPREAVLLALIENPNLDEQHVARLLARLDLSQNVLTAVAAGAKWAASEAVRLGLAQHPRTPNRIALAMVRRLYLFDLVRLNLLPSAPATIRRIAEEIILTRIPHLPVGQKLTLARRGPSRVAGALLAEGHAQALKLALNNPLLTESQVLRVLARVETPERSVAAVAQHPKWSIQYTVRVALLRNPHTPPPCLLAFLPSLKLRDLKDTAALQNIAPHARKYIERELERRRTAINPS